MRREDGTHERELQHSLRLKLHSRDQRRQWPTREHFVSRWSERVAARYAGKAQHVLKETGSPITDVQREILHSMFKSALLQVPPPTPNTRADRKC